MAQGSPPVGGGGGGGGGGGDCGTVMTSPEPPPLQDAIRATESISAVLVSNFLKTTISSPLYYVPFCFA